MRQKVLIAAALLHNPRVVVLDEPASGLDIATSLALASDGRIIFYSSHELEVIERISTRVVILHQGVVVGDDTPTRLRERADAPSLEEVFTQLAVRQSVETIANEVLETTRLH